MINAEIIFQKNHNRTYESLLTDQFLNDQFLKVILKKKGKM